MNKVSKEELDKVIKTSDGSFANESDILEYKKNFVDIENYVKPIVAFANASGGYIVFGVEETKLDGSKKIIGLSEDELKKFMRLDGSDFNNKMSSSIAPMIKHYKTLYEIDGKTLAIIYIESSNNKPVMVIKSVNDKSSGKALAQSGDIFYRYIAQNERIKYAELQKIIQERISNFFGSVNQYMQKVITHGHENVAILDKVDGELLQYGSSPLLLHKDDLEGVSFIKEGEFVETKGEGKPVLRIVSDAKLVEAVDVYEKIVKQKITDIYPLTYKEMVEKIKQLRPDIKDKEIQKIIKNNNIKTNEIYSEYNFRSKSIEEEYRTTDKLPKGIPSLYNDQALEFIIQKYDEMRK